MFRINLRLGETKDLIKMLKDNNISNEYEYLLKIFTANKTKEDILKITEEIIDEFPKIKIMGTSCCGIIYNGKQYEDTLITITKYEDTEFKKIKVIWEGKDVEEVVSELESVCINNDIKANIIEVVFGDYYYGVSKFVDEFNKKFKNTKLVGAVAGDEINNNNIKAFIFDEHGVIKNGAIFNMFYGEKLRTYVGVNSESVSISPVFTLTEVEGINWITVNNEPVTEWVKDYLGVEFLKEYKDWNAIAKKDPLFRFNIMLEGHKNVFRYIRYDSKYKNVTQYYSELPKNTRFSIGYTYPDKCIDRSYEICSEITKEPIEYMFCYMCVFRKMYFQNIAKWELLPYKNYNICGAFMFGEIGNINGVNEFFNGSSVIVGAAERRKYVLPDMLVFDRIYNIQNKNNILYNLSVMLKSKTVTENGKLITRLVEQQELMKKQINKNIYLGISNMIQYKEDRQKKLYNKLILIKIENSSALISFLGQDEYYKNLKEQIDILKKCMFEKLDFEPFEIYAINEQSLVIAVGKNVDEEYFLDSSKKIADMFSIMKFENIKLPMVSRFVAVVNQQDMLEVALDILKENARTQSNFLMSKNYNMDRKSIETELNIINVINEAIKNDLVIPYYHAIHDNKNNCIGKYEALMRLVDKEGRVYYPNEFMEVSKKYHLYAKLSETMIRKVFKDFDGTRKRVSLNLSGKDINVLEFRKNFYYMVSKLRQPENFIIEILEDEEFRDIGILKEFIKQVRMFNLSIAIDDFGAGYSNLLEITEISPEFIKIDGSIIKNIANNWKSQAILKTVVYLAKKLGTKVIAEFVENKEIQEAMEKIGVDYSQGYYFAKPVPFEKLKIK